MTISRDSNDLEFRGERLRMGGYDDFGTSRIMDYGDRRAGYGAYYSDRDDFRLRDPHGPRGPLRRAADEVASWLGDHNAELRRVDDLSPHSRDSALLEMVTARLSGRMDTDAVRIRADRGTVTLSGHVATLAERELAGRLLADLPGLRNELTFG